MRNSIRPALYALSFLLCAGLASAERVAGPSQSAQVDQADGGYRVVYDHVSLAQPIIVDASALDVRCEEGAERCTIASEGERVPFRSARGLELVSQAAHRTIAAEKASAPSNLAKAQLRLASLQERIPAMSFDGERQQKPRKEREIFPITMTVSGGFGNSVNVIDENPDTHAVEYQNRTPGNFNFFVGFPVLPRKDHKVGHVTANFGLGTTWITANENASSWVDSTPPDPRTFDYTATKYDLSSKRRGAKLFEPFNVEYESPRAANFSVYGGVGLAVGHNDQRLITNDSVTDSVYTCTMIVSYNGVPDHCGQYDVNSSVTTTNSVYADGVSHWSGATHTFFGGAKFRLGYYADLLYRVEKFYAGQPIVSHSFGVQFNVWPQKYENPGAPD